MALTLKQTLFITLDDDGSITRQSEAAVAIPDLPEIQIHGFGAAQDWQGALRGLGRADLIGAVQALLDASEANGGAT
ncbi:hypothetical protein [Agrobacterium rosae]|uniref:hypothetical protein n=1 Tax=Agrobacterium rosae TaxID=1972867 RepID=UPI0020340E4D|nr:hypothetical protein [Agrobacterium rosae]MCM2436240.1 hypothetical protein [Agrobacterium rosae]